MALDVQKIIQTLITTEQVLSRKRSAPDYRPVVTISRDLGAGGEEIAQRLAVRLETTVYDKQILDSIAERAKVDRGLMAKLDERIRDWRDEWIHALLSGTNVTLSAYRRHLVDTVLCISPRGGVILGRGAHIILATREAFRLRVVGSSQVCAERVSAREGVETAQALERVKKAHAERDQFLHELFGFRLGDAETFDLIINTDRLSDWDSAVDLILEAMRRMGFNISPARVHG